MKISYKANTVQVFFEVIIIILQKLLKFLFADLIVTKMIEQRKEPRGLTTVCNFNFHKIMTKRSAKSVKIAQNCTP